MPAMVVSVVSCVRGAGNTRVQSVQITASGRGIATNTRPKTWRPPGSAVFQRLFAASGWSRVEPTMKHLCEHCGQKYAIPDERLAGKVLKVRCQKCTGVMLVDGSSLVSGNVSIPPVVARVREEAPRKEWYVGIAGKPYGPYARNDVIELVERGEVRMRTFMWRSGLDAWQRVCDGGAVDWVKGAVEFREAHADAQAYRTPTKVFEAVPPSLVSDGRSYFPDPTLHSGWSVLSEDARQYLEQVARREVEHQRSRQWGTAAINVGAFLALTLLGVAGAYAASLF
jgi:predicted Zn finger-like uncharacterized protein